MNEFKTGKTLCKKRIEGIEGAISVHQSAIDFGCLCEVEIKCRQEFIQELMVGLEAYRHYLICLNSRGEGNGI